MANIFFIHRFPFNKEAFIRDEFNYFLKQGHTVKYLDIASLLKKRKLVDSCPQELKKHVVYFTSKREFAKFLLVNNENTLVVTDVGLLANSAWMYIAIFRSKISYLLFENSVLLFGPAPKLLISTLHSKKLIQRLNFKKIFIKPVELVQYTYATLIKKSASLIITSKNKLSSEKAALKGEKTKVEYTVSMDYAQALKITDEELILQPYAVFIDQYFNHHPDFKTKHIVHSFSAKQYYGELNKFLVNFEEQSGLKVVIASHPRRSEAHQQDFYPQFPLFYNKTGALIKNANLVLTHFSTAINFAVIFNKPFILLDSNLFEGGSVKGYLNTYANYFNITPINMSLFSDDNSVAISIDSSYNINEKKYRSFEETLLKHPKATNKTFVELIDIELNKLKS
jgi:hypothetical protein